MNRKYEKRAILLILLIFLVCGIVTGIRCLRRENTVSNRDSGGGVGLVIDPNEEDSVSHENADTAEQGVAISGQESMTIPANKKEIAVDFYNPQENEGLYYLTFELRLYNNNEQGYEVLYASGLVEPGKRINRITLSRELEKGVYEAVIHVQPYRMNEERTLTNNADMRIRLIVK